MAISCDSLMRLSCRPPVAGFTAQAPEPHVASIARRAHQTRAGRGIMVARYIRPCYGATHETALADDHSWHRRDRRRRGGSARRSRVRDLETTGGTHVCEGAKRRARMLRALLSYGRRATGRA